MTSRPESVQWDRKQIYGFRLMTRCWALLCQVSAAAAFVLLVLGAFSLQFLSVSEIQVESVGFRSNDSLDHVFTEILL